MCHLRPARQAEATDLWWPLPLRPEGRNIQGAHADRVSAVSCLVITHSTTGLPVVLCIFKVCQNDSCTAGIIMEEHCKI